MMVRVLQANLQHSKAASAVLTKRLAGGEFAVALIQEPWVRRGFVLGLNMRGFKLLVPPVRDPRVCILVSEGLGCVLVQDLCSRDLVAAKVCDSGSGRSVMVASGYFPYDAGVRLPAVEVERLVSWVSTNNVGLVLGCDANAHHRCWGSSDTNPRGERLLEFVVSSGLLIGNVGNEPTFRNRVRSEVIDLTLLTPGLSRDVRGWHVSDEPSLSDHRHICFSIAGLEHSVIERRNPRRADWAKFEGLLADRVKACSGRVENLKQLDTQSLELAGALVGAFDESCPVSRRVVASTGWWSSELGSRRKRVRALFRQAKVCGNWETYHRALTEYNLAVRRAKRSSWRSFCTGLMEVREAARLVKALANDRACSLGCVRTESGERSVEPEVVLRTMALAHFPGCVVGDAVLGDCVNPGVQDLGLHSSRVLASRVFTHGNIRWAIGRLGPYKAPGMDGVWPICLQKGLEVILTSMCHLFRESLVLGQVPRPWRTSRVVFIPKPGRMDYMDPKAFRPVCLSNFFLKIMEKLVQRWICEGPLKAAPLHPNQHAYRAGRSCDSALHQLVSKIEGALDNREVALGAFLDIQGAFDCTRLEFTLDAIRERGVNEQMCRWIGSLLSERMVSLTHLGTNLEVRTTRGFPQGGVLSPLLWNIVLDGLLRRLSDSGVFAQGYADDLVVMVTGKFEHTISELLSRALRVVEVWCGEAGLMINPSKVVVVPFTRRRKLNKMVTLKVQGTVIRPQMQVKYLGVILDQKLHWGAHINRVIDRGKWALMTCRRLAGGKWGLRPRIMHWLYVSMVRPALLHCATVWWPCVELSKVAGRLASLQRMACLAITGVVSSSPGAALGCCLDLPPLDVVVKAAARRGAYSLQLNGLWRPRELGHTRIVSIVTGGGVLDMISDHMDKRYSFSQSFESVIVDREEWREGGGALLQSDEVWFTDGSKTCEGTGAGIHGPRPDHDFSISMGMFPTVFQAEVVAILECCREILLLGSTDKSISIFSDSQAAIKALSSQEFSSRLVWECYMAISVLGRRNKVRLVWVPGHSGIAGNEAADALANIASGTMFIGPQPFCGVSRSAANQSVAGWMREQHVLRWRRVAGHRMSKLILRGPSSHLARDLLRLERRKLKLVVEMITGHGHWRKHMHRMGIFAGVPSCRKCGLQDETAEHLLFDCEALERVRYTVFGLVSRNSGISQENLAGSILQFCRLMGLPAEEH